MTKGEKVSFSRKAINKINGKGKEATQQKIYEAVELLTTGSTKITKKTIAAAVGVSVDTVKSYWKPFKEIVEDFNNKLITTTTIMNEEEQPIEPVQEQEPVLVDEQEELRIKLGQLMAVNGWKWQVLGQQVNIFHKDPNEGMTFNVGEYQRMIAWVEFGNKSIANRPVLI